MNRVYVRHIRILSLLVSSIPVAYAQEKPTTLPLVVVTATGLEENLSLTSASVSVITAEQIQERQLYSLDSALRGLPGVALAGPGLGSGPSGLFVRGTKTEHTPVVLDGRPLSANLAGSFNLETVPLDNLEQVEVLRGPASWLYGGGALGGVVNLISRDPRDLSEPVSGLFAEGGSFSSFRTGIRTEGVAGPFFYSLESHHFRTDGHRINGDFEDTGAGARLGYEISPDVVLDVDLRYVAADAGVPGPASGFGANDLNNRLITEAWSISPRLVWRPSAAVTHSLIWQTTRFRQAAQHFDYFGGNNRVQVNQNYADYRWDYEIHEQLTVSAGLRGQWRQYDRYNDDAGVRDILENEDSFSAFTQVDWEVSPHVSAQAGLRYEETTDFGAEPTGRAGLVWHQDELGWKIHAAYGSAFAPPSPQDRQPALFGNPDLVRPERGKGWEFGVAKNWDASDLRASATWFRTEVDHLIEFDPTLFVLQRVDEAVVQGMETELHWNEGGLFEVGLNYTYLDARNESDQRRLVRRPRHTVQASCHWRPTERILLGAELAYVAGREDGFGSSQSDMEDYKVVRLMGRYQVSANVEFFARVENLLDETYQEVQGYPAPRVAGYAGFRLTF